MPKKVKKSVYEGPEMHYPCMERLTRTRLPDRTIVRCPKCKFIHISMEDEKIRAENQKEADEEKAKKEALLAVIREKMSKLNVIIYSTDKCKYCKTAKKFFDEWGVQYVEYDVGTDLEKREEMVEKSGQMGVPVIDIEGEVFVGFKKEIIADKLHKCIK